MAVLSVKFLTLLCGFLVLGLLANQGSCKPNQMSDNAEDDEDSDYNADEPDYADTGDEEEEEEENTGPPPTFISQPISLSLRPGDTAYLPCQVENPGSYVVLWWNGSTTLTMEGVVVTKDPRVVKHKLNNSLEIHNVTPEDSNMYTCQIVAQPALNLTHKLSVSSPARIVKITPEIHARTVHVGDPLTLECITAGWPEPTIIWTREGKHLPGGKESQEGKTLSFPKVSPHHAGTYQCVADNGIKPTARGTATIHVNYAPEVTLEPATKIRTGVSEDVTLMCTVHASPNAHVEWLKDGKPVSEKKHHRLNKDGSKHKFSIKRLQRDDFGKYTCFAENTLGATEKFVEITGEPNIPRFINAHHTDDMNTTLEWAVESYSNISGYELMYRKKMDSNWITIYPKTDSIEGNVYQVKQSLGALPPGDYEAVLRVVNEFGATESERHTFKGNEKAEKHDSDDRPETPAAETSIGVPAASGPNSAADRPRILALLTIFILSSFFL